MPSLMPSRRLKDGRTGPSASGVFSLLVVVLFCIQLSRFYLAAQLNPEECLELSHSHEAAPAHSHDGHHEHASESFPDKEDGGFYFQHCKDSFDGMGLTPVQPLGVPVAISQQRTETISFVPLPEACAGPENHPSPRFPPPRHLG